MNIFGMLKAFMAFGPFKRFFSSSDKAAGLLPAESLLPAVESSPEGVISQESLEENNSGHKIEIDRTTVLPILPLPDLKLLDGMGRTFLFPDMAVDVRLHPLSVNSSFDAEIYTCSNRQFNTLGTVVAKIQNHYWFPETGFLISKNGRVWRHSLLAQYIDPHFLSTEAVEKKINADESEDYIFHEQRLGNVRTIDEPVLITSHYASHNYGHFMLDMVPLIQLGMKEGIKMVSRPILDWQWPVYKRIGVNPESVSVISEPKVYLREVFTSNNHQASSTMVPSPMHRQVYAGILDKVPTSILKKKWSKRIFLSRSGAKSRNIRNRQQLEDSLKTEGFETILPEKYSFDEQIGIFSQAELIVTEFGAIMANVVFCRKGTKVIEIIPENQNDPWSVNLCASLELEHVVIFHKIRDEDRESLFFGGREHKNIYFNFDADVELIINTVRQL